MAQYSPCLVQAIRSMPSSSDGRSKPSTDGRRHVSQQPDVLQLSLILWCGLQIELREPLKCSALLHRLEGLSSRSQNSLQDLQEAISLCGFTSKPPPW